MEKLKVVIVDDAAFMRKALAQILGGDPEIEVVDAVKNGLEALQVIKAKRPDVITLDMDMPIMDGLTAIRHLMIEAPLPIVVLSSLVQDGSVIFEALRLGVVDFIPKPSGAISLNIHGEKKKIIDRVKMAYSVKLHNLRRVRLSPQQGKSGICKAANSLPSPEYLITLGTSISGSNTLIRLISQLSPAMPATVVAVQEISPKILSSFVRALNQFVPWTVEEGRDGVLLNQGTFYICSNENSIRIEKTGSGVACLRVNGADPQPLNLLFATAADVFRQKALGVLLTGLGNDGVEGFARIRQKGGMTIGEDTDCCVHPHLVGNALRHGVVDFILHEKEIPGVIHSVLTSSRQGAAFLAGGGDRIPETGNRLLRKPTPVTRAATDGSKE